MITKKSHHHLGASIKCWALLVVHCLLCSVQGWTSTPTTTRGGMPPTRHDTLSLRLSTTSTDVNRTATAENDDMAVEDDNSKNDWRSSSSGSFGNLLLQMQRQESQPDVLDLDQSSASPSAEDPIPGKGDESSDEFLTMDADTARELDESIVRLDTTSENVAAEEWEAVTDYPLASLYQAMEHKNDDDKTTATPDTPPLVQRIQSDMRLLALNIAASTQTVEEWKVLSRQTGGLYPLLELIHQGARDAQSQAVRAACSACRVIRDLSAISPNLAAVLVDGMLRANSNTTTNDTLLRDLCTILQYADQPQLRRPRRRSKGSSNAAATGSRMQSKLYVCQLLLAMTVASDHAVSAIRATPGLTDALVGCSSFAVKQKARRWIRYPGELAKWLWRRRCRQQQQRTPRRPFLEAAKLGNDLPGNVQRTANQVLAAIGYNQWQPKSPGQRGLRILSLDGGGSRGMVAVTAVRDLLARVGNGAEVADCFDLVAGTSTGGIIAFLTGLRRESSAAAVERYNVLIRQIFVKSALSTPLMFFTTASYDESHFMEILSDILGDSIMLDSRADPAVPLVFCVTSKMSSIPTHVALMRNYNYGHNDVAPDSFVVDPVVARQELDLGLEWEHPVIRYGTYNESLSTPSSKSNKGSRYPGSFRVLQRFALRASTAAPTVFKPVKMGGEIYADGGIVSSNPAALAIHEARMLFPDIPIEMVVSVGTGQFEERKSAPRIGWDGIIGQIVDSACDGEQTHHILEDILRHPTAVHLMGRRRPNLTRYYRFNPLLGPPDEFPIDETDPVQLQRMKDITKAYMDGQEEQIEEIRGILGGRRRWGKS